MAKIRTGLNYAALPHRLSRPSLCRISRSRHTPLKRPVFAFALIPNVRMAIFNFIKGWYNAHRRPSSLDYLSPALYEQQFQAEA